MRSSIAFKSEALDGIAGAIDFHYRVDEYSTRSRSTLIFTSGVTRVGDTRGGKLMVSPYFFLTKKLTTFFSHRPVKVLDLFLAVVSRPLPSFHVVYPVFFLNSATKIHFIRVSPHGYCHPGRYAPSAPFPSDATDS